MWRQPYIQAEVPEIVEPGELRRKMREATRELHEAIDDRFSTIAHEPEVAPYHAFVRMSEACHASLEAWLEPCLPADIAARRPSLARVLGDDRRAMGLGPLPCAPFRLPCRDLPEAAGVVYVLDGSRLGARMLARTIAARRDGARFSTRYLEAAAGAEPVFAALDAIARRLSTRDVGRAVEAAVAAFVLFEEAGMRAESATS